MNPAILAAIAARQRAEVVELRFEDRQGKLREWLSMLAARAG